MKKILCFALLCWISPENPHAEDHSEQELKRIQNRHLVVKITESYPTQQFDLLCLCTIKSISISRKGISWNSSACLLFCEQPALTSAPKCPSSSNPRRFCLWKRR